MPLNELGTAPESRRTVSEGNEAFTKEIKGPMGDAASEVADTEFTDETV